MGEEAELPEGLPEDAERAKVRGPVPVPDRGDWGRVRGAETGGLDPGMEVPARGGLGEG